MAETRTTQQSAPGTTPAQPAPKSPVRTLILFGILLLVIAAYAHDYFIAAPAAVKADDDIHELVAKRNAQDVKVGELVKSKDIQELLGKQPSKVIEEKDHTIEVYRYWGGMLPQRQYISVLYVGPERRYDVHYRNTMPEEGDLPSGQAIPEPAVDDKSGDAKSDAPAPGDDAAPPESEAPATEAPAAPAETEAPAAPESSEAPAAAEPATETESATEPAESTEEKSE